MRRLNYYREPAPKIMQDLHEKLPEEVPQDSHFQPVPHTDNDDEVDDTAAHNRLYANCTDLDLSSNYQDEEEHCLCVLKYSCESL